MSVEHLGDGAVAEEAGCDGHLQGEPVFALADVEHVARVCGAGCLRASGFPGSVLARVRPGRHRGRGNNSEIREERMVPCFSSVARISATDIPKDSQ